MKVIKFILGSALGAILILVAIGFFLPSNWRVERSIIIKAPPEKIYPYIANIKTGWPQWNSFDKEDSNIQFTYTGPEGGEGASRSWTSEKVGSGVQRITKANIHSGIDFEVSTEGAGFVVYGSINMEPHPEGTKVTWRDTGNMGANPIYKIMGYLMDSMLGKNLQKSLEQLKGKVEAEAP
ncbi:SRPBCC family protein [Bdellovibrio svalbardensis]|uniref:SRPBCC family protein n=1 Tax=Bdellovibrio svalbardensis TaxID=2972972 RepID=A0ABT6DEB2_9BACT|nr:SRPBCC family protein [Bdellovibrio svalbardensis]MDG0815175.1 SRPBCC family protein [Bdellovibrio svalbardensis]